MPLLLTLLGSLLLSSAVSAQSCYRDICLGHTPAELAKREWNPSEYQLPSDERIRSSRYAGPADVQTRLLSVSRGLDQRTVMLLPQLSGACSAGWGLGLHRGNPEAPDVESLSVSVEPVSRDAGLTQSFEVVEIRAYLPIGDVSAKRQLFEICTALIPSSETKAKELHQSCLAGWARSKSADQSSFVTISRYQESQIRVRLERADVDVNNAELLARLPACLSKVQAR